MTRTESRVERLEKEVTEVHERLTRMGDRLERLDQEVREKANDTQVRLEGMKSSMKVIKEYLRDLKEVMIGKGKSLMDLRPSTVLTADPSNMTSNGREPTPNTHLPTGATPIQQPRGERNIGGRGEMSKIGQRGVDDHGGG